LSSDGRHKMLRLPTYRDNICTSCLQDLFESGTLRWQYHDQYYYTSQEPHASLYSTVDCANLHWISVT